MRWIEASTAAGDLLGDAAQLIIVGDREFDIYSQFVRLPPGVDLIVRAAQNRKLADAERLFDAPSDWREFGTMDIGVPPTRPGEAGRIAQVNVKAGRVCIAKPRHGAKIDPVTVTLTYVEVSEINPPRAFPEKAESGDSHAGANMIQASYWDEASMDGEAVFGRLAQTRGRGDW